MPAAKLITDEARRFLFGVFMLTDCFQWWNQIDLYEIGSYSYYNSVADSQVDEFLKWFSDYCKKCCRRRTISSGGEALMWYGIYNYGDKYLTEEFWEKLWKAEYKHIMFDDSLPNTDYDQIIGKYYVGNNDGIIYKPVLRGNGELEEASVKEFLEKWEENKSTDGEG